MSKILTIFTGGTIGSKKTKDNLISLAKPEEYELISMYHSKWGGDEHFDCTQPLNISSENMTNDDLNILINHLKSTDFSKYKGVILTHGTDTLAYTANILSILLAGINLPFVIIGSSKTMSDDGFDGIIHFRDAINFINQAIPGTYVVFQKDGKSTVYFAERITTAIPFTDVYHSVGGVDLGEINESAFSIYSKNPSLDELKSHVFEPLLKTFDAINANVLKIVPYTGMNYKNFDLSSVDCVVHELFHSASANITDNEAYSILYFMKRLKDRNIPLYFANFSSSYEDKDAYLYESTSVLWRMGAKLIANTSLEFAYAKSLFAYSMYKDDEAATKFMQTALHFERIG